MKGAKREIGFDLPANYGGVEPDKTTIVRRGQTPMLVGVKRNCFMEGIC
jgi:hypothetical protein